MALTKKYPEIERFFSEIEDDLIEIRSLLKELFLAMKGNEVEEIRSKEEEIAKVINKVSEKLIQAISTVVQKRLNKKGS